MMQDENIAIRALEPEDLEYLYRWENNMDMWDISETLLPFSHFTLKKYIENAHRDIYETKQVRLMITKKEDNAPLGLIELYGFDPFHERAGLGIMIHDRENRQKGYAKSAVELILYYAFETLCLNQVYCYVPNCNIASIHLFEKMGFERSGYLKQWLKRGGEREDVILFQYLAGDWKNK